MRSVGSHLYTVTVHIHIFNNFVVCKILCVTAHNAESMSVYTVVDKFLILRSQEQVLFVDWGSTNTDWHINILYGNILHTNGV